MQEKETWFPKFKPYQGNLDTTPVQTDEYLPAGKVLFSGCSMCLPCLAQPCWHPY